MHVCIFCMCVYSHISCFLQCTMWMMQFVPLIEVTTQTIDNSISTQLPDLIGASKFIFCVGHRSSYILNMLYSHIYYNFVYTHIISHLIN